MSTVKGILEDFLKKNNYNSVVIIDTTGTIITSLNSEHADVTAAMSGAILSMCEKFLNDLEKGNLKQLYLKASNGMIIFNKINFNKSIVVFADGGVNLGLFLRNVEDISVILDEENFNTLESTN